jgi:UDP-N-acetylmuramate: L-alanyl-gamma-D-glutamyl-meso-diaminopimelate ligase
VASIQRQFHQLVRTIPGSGLIVWNAAEPALDEALAMGCWTPRESLGARGVAGDWQAELLADDGSEFRVSFRGEGQGRVRWATIGRHNVDNALAAIAAARHAGVPAERAIDALTAFRGVRRRMEVRGCVGGVTVYDDFAHHPTAIATTIAGLRRRVGRARIVAVLEPRSNTMKLGVHREQLAPSLAEADRVWLYRPADLGWDVGPVATAIGAHASVATDIATLAAQLAAESRPGDHVLIMSNGGFGGLHGRLLEALGSRTGR